MESEITCFLIFFRADFQYSNDFKMENNLLQLLSTYPQILLWILFWL